MNNYKNMTCLKFLVHIFRQTILFLTVMLVVSFVLSTESIAQTDIMVGVFPFKPMIFMDSEGIARGIYPDLIDQIAKDNDWTVTYVDGSWNDGIERVKSGNLDLITSIMYSPERAQYLDYSQESIFTVWGEVYIRPDSAIDNILELEGKKVAIMTGDLSGENFRKLVQEFHVNCEIVEVLSHSEVFAKVKGRQVDAGVTPNIFGIINASENNLVTSSIIFNPKSLYFSVPAGKQSQLLAKLDETLKQWKLDKESHYYNTLTHWLNNQYREKIVIPNWVIYSAVGGFGTIVFLILWSKILKTQVRQRTRSLHESEQKYRTLLANQSDAVFLHKILDEGFAKFSEVNVYAIKQYGYSLEEFCDISPGNLSSPAGLKRIQLSGDLVHLSETGHHIFENEHVKKNGEKFPVEISSTIIDLPDGKYCLSVARDISARKQLEQIKEHRIASLTNPQEDIGDVQFTDLFDLAQIQQIQDAFANATGVASHITDIDGNPITKPSNFCDLCQNIIRKTAKGAENCCHSDALLGKFNFDGPKVQPCMSGGLWDGGASIMVGNRHVANWLIGQVLDESADLESMMNYARTIGADEEAYFQALKKVKRMPGEQFQEVCNALFLIAGQLSNMALQNVQQARHISERQKTAKERELLIHQLQDKTAELERFIYTVSHDLKSPLITISGFLGFLKEDFESKNEADFTSNISRISLAAERMKQLLDELLELSRIGRQMNPAEKVNLGAVVPEAIELIAGRINEFSATVDVNSDLPEVMVDRQRILQVYENLIDNAVKFSSGQNVPPHITIGVRLGEDEIPVLFVSDNGAGIESIYADKIFDLFEKLDPHSSGTGVGLAIVKRVIEVHGGKIWVESAGIGQGTTFCFTLPQVNT